MRKVIVISWADPENNWSVRSVERVCSSIDGVLDYFNNYLGDDYVVEMATNTIGDELDETKESVGSTYNRIQRCVEVGASRNFFATAKEYDGEELLQTSYYRIQVRTLY